MPRKAKPPVPGQLLLFDLVERMDRAREMASVVKRALAEDLRLSLFPRDQVASRMTTLLGAEISLAQLDSWTAPTKTLHRLPLEYLPAFAQATGRWGALRAVAEGCGAVLVVPDQVRQELGLVEEQRRQLAGRERTLRAVNAAIETGVLG
jgi:hypothetical protein